MVIYILNTHIIIIYIFNTLHIFIISPGSDVLFLKLLLNCLIRIKIHGRNVTIFIILSRLKKHLYFKNTPTHMSKRCVCVCVCVYIYIYIYIYIHNRVNIYTITLHNICRTLAVDKKYENNEREKYKHMYPTFL